MKITQSIVIDAPIETVWQAAVADFDKIGTWSSGVIWSKAAESPAILPDTEMSGRVCMTSIGELQETFFALDKRQHRFSYRLKSDAFPAFMKEATNTWEMVSVSGRQTRLTMQGNTKLSWLASVVMRMPLWLQGRKSLRSNLEEFKYYVETGNPHPRKLAAAAV